MFIKKILSLFIFVLGLAGCMNDTGWNHQYGTEPAGNPGSLYGTFGGGAQGKRVAVLLPQTGDNAEIGAGISRAVELAFVQNQNSGLDVSFFDISGTKAQRASVISNALAINPDIVIGPVFSEDVQMLREMKHPELPALSFSSDAAAIGDGVFSVALFPPQSVETIIKKAALDGAQKILIFAPNNVRGGILAGTALDAANISDVRIAGLLYYAEGEQNSIQEAAKRGAMFDARKQAQTRAREVLADILNKENLGSSQRANISSQLNRISKRDTLGPAPFDAVLFLGNTTDSKSLASFLRYFEVGTRDAKFYGTTVWDSKEMFSDITLSGSEFPALSPINDNFKMLYQAAAGHTPTNLDAFGYDAARLAIGALHADSTARYLLAPGGYNGLNGLIRLRPSGISERALDIMELNGSGEPRKTKPAPANFTNPIYETNIRTNGKPAEIEVIGTINPNNYIKIPENLAGKYRSKSYGNTSKQKTTPENPVQEITLLPEDDSPIIENPDFKPVPLENVNKTYIDNVEIN